MMINELKLRKESGGAWRYSVFSCDFTWNIRLDFCSQAPSSSPTWWHFVRVNSVTCRTRMITRSTNRIWVHGERNWDTGVVCLEVADKAMSCDLLCMRRNTQSCIVFCFFFSLFFIFREVGLDKLWLQWHSKFRGTFLPDFFSLFEGTS